MPAATSRAFRSHDVHANVNAFSSMAASGEGQPSQSLSPPSRDRSTPCGGCLDWIFELGRPDTLVAFRAHRGSVQVLRYCVSTERTNRWMSGTAYGMVSSTMGSARLTASRSRQR